MSLQKKFLKSKPVCKVTFSLPAEAVSGGEKVLLLGEFNDWKPEKGIPMQLSDGEFKAVVELPAGREFQFRYLIDDETWENDWAADKYAPSPYGADNSVVIAVNGN